jgi:hypothetical protein
VNGLRSNSPGTRVSAYNTDSSEEIAC